MTPGPLSSGSSAAAVTRRRALAGLSGALYAGKRAARPFPGTGWNEVPPEAADVDPDKLKAAVAYMDGRFGPQGARELAVIRRGCLIWKGPAADSCHNAWSCTKTFTSTVLGLLAAEGKCALDDLAVKYMPELAGADPKYERLRLRHLASMSGGYRGQVTGVSKEQPWGEPIHYLKPAASLFEPGTEVQYNDHDVALLGAILTQLAGESMKALFRRRIAGPIGMTRWNWGAVGEWRGVELNNPAGTPNTPGIETTALEMARFGLLYLNRGEWDGKRLLPAWFVDEATRNQVGAAGKSWFLHGRYGFYWWTNDPRPDGKRPWPSAPPRSYTSQGNGCNFCYVLPEWDMVVVRMGTIPVASSANRANPLDVAWDGFLARLGGALKAV